MDEVISILLDNNIGIACISETWLSSQSNSITSIIRNSGFDILHNYREKRGAGVAIIWNTNLNKQIRNSSVNKSFLTFQYQNITLIGKFKINLICIYRLQETSFKLFIEELNELISIQNSCHPLVLTGDFNVHYENNHLSDMLDLEYLTSSFGLTQFVLGPTNKFGHMIDLLFANSHDFEMQNILPESYNLGDHFPIFFELPNVETPSLPSKKCITYRDIKSINVPSFAMDLRVSLGTALSSKVENSSFSELSDIYTETIKRQLDNVAPLQTRTLTTSSSPPWMDGEYKSNRATRRRLERRWKKSRLREDKQLYVSQRELCSKMSVDKRSNYFSDLIKSKSGDQRALFSIISKLFDKTKSSGALPQHENAKELANRFNDFYIDKVRLLRSKIPKSNDTPHITDNYSGTIMDTFQPTTVLELRNIIKESGIKTSFHDVLPANLLKEVIEELLPHLCDLVNKSLSTGSVDGIKESIIVPLLKKAGLDAEILKNYRPVADLVFLSKLSERVVFKRINQHMSSNNLHCKYEHGYKKGHSPETLLARILNDLLLAMDKKLVTILLLIDLSAAFDTVDIDLLLHILQTEIGINGLALDWFDSFLRGRNQRVLIENTLSDVLKVYFGVPQGSVLGPILFNIYIRSLFSLIEKCGFNTSGYADDNNAYQSFVLNFQYDVIIQKLPDLMNKITEWMNRHFLKINPDKTEIILFLPSNMKSVNTINGSFLGGNCIRFSNSVKNLGFTLDRFLTMECHVNAIVSHCYKLISDVGRHRHILSAKDTETLMHAIVSSRLDYCNVLLYGVNKNVIQKMQKVQNAAARLISRRNKRQSVRDVLKDLHWLRVEERIIFKLLVLTFKCFHEIAPESLSSLISIRNPAAFLLNNVYLDSDYGRRSFTYCAPRYWNALPFNVRSVNSLDTFKRQTKHILFSDFNNFKRTVFMYN